MSIIHVQKSNLKKQKLLMIGKTLVALIVYIFSLRKVFIHFSLTWKSVTVSDITMAWHLHVVKVGKKTDLSFQNGLNNVIL